MTRYALVIGADTYERLYGFLPSNYHVKRAWLNGTVLVIFGEDKAGWTLDDYVIPRLNSGLMQAVEIPSQFGRQLTL